MHPYLYVFGVKLVQAYPLLYGMGIAVGSIVVLVLGHFKGVDRRRLAHLLLLCSVSILVGGRLFYVLQSQDQFSRNAIRAFDISDAGQVFYGGCLLTIACIIVFTRLFRLPFGTTVDMLAVGAPLGLAVGRWACFCRGCCYGTISSLPWAVQYPKHVDLHGHIVGPPAFLNHLNHGLITQTAGSSLPVHPAPLYESMASVAIFFIMLWLWKSGRLQGRLIVIYPVCYAFTRFLLDFTREYQMAFWGLTVSQVISLGVFVVGGIVLAVTSWRSRQRSSQVDA